MVGELCSITRIKYVLMAICVWIYGILTYTSGHFAGERGIGIAILGIVTVNGKRCARECPSALGLHKDFVIFVPIERHFTCRFLVHAHTRL